MKLDKGWFFGEVQRTLRLVPALPFRRFFPALFSLLGLIPGNAETLQLMGRATLPRELAVEKTKLGGLSGISYDATTKSFWAVSDDSAYKGGAPRIYQISLQFQEDLQPKVTGVLILRDEKGRPFPVADCEGIACTGKGAVWVSSEGKAGKNGALPFVRLFSLTNGKTLRSLPLPAAYLPTDASGKLVSIESPAQINGVVSNRALESCAVTPDLQTVYTANEASLVQEKAPGEGKGGASIFNATQVRISALEAKTGRCLGQKLYISDAGCLFGSISDVATLDNRGNLLVLERRVIRLQEGTGSCGIRIYRVDFNQPDATDLRKIASVTGKNVTSLTKTLLFDSQKAGLDNLDNLEGIVLVPLPKGKRGVLAVSDDNFSNNQETQLILFQWID